MEYVVASCSDTAVTKKIRKVVENDFQHEYRLQCPGSVQAVLECLNFEMPELLIINFSDDELNPGYLRDRICEDPWLHNSGIVGIYDRHREKEEEILEANKAINLLTLIDFTRIDSHLGKTLRIISENRQLIFQGFLADKLVNRMTGSFEIDNRDYLVAPVYGGLLATTLLRLGKIPSDQRNGIQMALSELILNSIEHGNCGISYAEKSRWLAAGEAMNELIVERCRDPEVAGRRVFLDWDFDDEQSRFLIRDEGRGFDVRAFRDRLADSRKVSLHGRGILMAQTAADRLYYNRIGNQVTMIVELQAEVRNAFPAGFSDQEVIRLNPGDVVMRAGEFGDCIYYISSGRYTVYHRDSPVGRITPTDIFMGEMAFLLNNARSATVVADTPGQVVKIPRRAFIQVVKKFPQYSAFLSKILAQKLVRSNEKAAENFPPGLFSGSSFPEASADAPFTDPDPYAELGIMSEDGVPALVAVSAGEGAGEARLPEIVEVDINEF